MKTRPLNIRNAVRAGEQTAEEEGFRALPVDPFEIARRHDIEVIANADILAGISGALVRYGDAFGIIYSTRLQNEGFHRFSIAHELGHYFLEGHPERVLNSEGRHESSAGFVSDRTCELEADGFAAGLLMPGYLVRGIIASSTDGLEAIKRISQLSKTSLLATAIRFVDFTECACAVVVSSGQTIDFCFMSETLKDRGKDLTWISKGTKLPRNCLTSEFNSSESNVASAKSGSGDTELTDWFGGITEVSGIEEVIGLGAYGRSLTVISFPELPDDEAEEEEDLVANSLVPRFRR